MAMRFAHEVTIILDYWFLTPICLVGAYRPYDR